MSTKKVTLLLVLGNWMMYDVWCMMVHAPWPLHALYNFMLCFVFHVMTYDASYVCMWYLLHHIVDERKYYVCHVMSCNVKLCDELYDDYRVYMMHICTMPWMREKKRIMCNAMLWMKNIATSCMYICHVHQYTSLLYYVSTNAYLQYLCSSWYHADLFFFAAFVDTLTIVHAQIMLRGYVYKLTWWVHVHVCGPCVGKYHTSNLARN